MYPCFTCLSAAQSRSVSLVLPKKFPRKVKSHASHKQTKSTNAELAALPNREICSSRFLIISHSAFESRGTLKDKLLFVPLILDRRTITPTTAFIPTHTSTITPSRYPMHAKRMQLTHTTAQSTFEPGSHPLYTSAEQRLSTISIPSRRTKKRRARRLHHMS